MSNSNHAFVLNPFPVSGKVLPSALNYNFKMSNEIPKSEEVDNDELYESLRGFVIFGRCIGLLPYKGVFSKSSRNLRFSWRSVPCFISIGIIIVLIFNCVLETLRSATASKKNAFEIAQSIRSTLYYIWGSLVYVYFLTRSNSFFKIFQTWRSTSVRYTKPDATLKRDVILIATIVLVSGALENAILYWGYFEEAIELARGSRKLKENHSTLHSYYINSHPSWSKYISYNPFWAILAFVQHKFILFAWNVVDIWIALLGRALYFKFKALIEVSEEHLLLQQSNKDKLRFSNNPKAIDSKDSEKWLQIVKDHSALCKLLEVFEDFLSPIVFVSFSVNIYYVCMQLLDGLRVSEKNTLGEAINAPWSFIHLILRIYLVAASCSKINVYAHDIAKILHECPSECYSTDVARLDRRVIGGRDIGISGLGCFTLHYPCILSIIGVIFTFEIVLLQVVPTDDGKSC